MKVAQLYPTLSNPMDCSTPGFPVLHHLSEVAQTHVHWVSDAIQLSHPLSPLLLLLSVFPSIKVISNELALVIRWRKYWSFSISPSNEYSVLISCRMTDLISLQPRDSQEASPTPQFKSINSSVLSSTLTSMHDYWETIALTIQTFVGNVSSFNMLSRFVIAFLPRSKHQLISSLKSKSAMIWNPRK